MMLCCRCGHSSWLPVYGASLTGSADGCEVRGCRWLYWTSEGSSLPHIGHIGICVSLDSTLRVSSTSMVGRGLSLLPPCPTYTCKNLLGSRYGAIFLFV